MKPCIIKCIDSKQGKQNEEHEGRLYQIAWKWISVKFQHNNKISKTSYSTITGCLKEDFTYFFTLLMLYPKKYTKIFSSIELCSFRIINTS